MKHTFFLDSWTAAATKLLIALRSTYNDQFQNTRKKGKNGTVDTNF